MKPIYSMTGFASVQGTVGDGLGFVLNAKSVNHRFLDLQFRFPAGLDSLEMTLRQVLKERLRRGHVDVTLSLERSADGEGEMRVNDQMLSSALEAFRATAAKHGLESTPDLNVLLRLPGVLGVQRAGTARDTPAFEAGVTERGPELIELLQNARAAEGAALVAELRASMRRLATLSAEIGLLRGEVRDAHYERLRTRLLELLAGAEPNRDRVLTEAALLAERSDIEEENVRLITHVERFTAILDDGGEVGKRLDFLLQELNREANTMLSKTGGAAGEQGHRITEIGLELKAELERAREQVQNLE